MKTLQAEQAKVVCPYRETLGAELKASTADILLTNRDSEAHAVASARIAACAPGPGTLEPTPPTARTLMCNPVNPFVLADSVTTFAAFIAANGDDSYLSALT